jgi:hypothetical protein
VGILWGICTNEPHRDRTLRASKSATSLHQRGNPDPGSALITRRSGFESPPRYQLRPSGPSRFRGPSCVSPTTLGAWERRGRPERGQCGTDSPKRRKAASASSLSAATQPRLDAFTCSAAVRHPMLGMGPSTSRCGRLSSKALQQERKGFSKKTEGSFPRAISTSLVSPRPRCKAQL